MAEERQRETRIAGHDDALHSLLESLLADVPEHAAAAAETAAPPSTTPALALNPVADAPLTEQVTGEAAPGDRIPAWAAQGFRVLLFRCGEQRFAAPLLLMRSIGLLPGQWTHLPGQPAWHLGVVQYRATQVMLADLGLLIGVQARCQAPRYLLVLGEGREAVVCDQVEDAPMVAPAQVRWASPRPHRAWLAGLLVQQMCVLLDMHALGERMRHG